MLLKESHSQECHCQECCCTLLSGPVGSWQWEPRGPGPHCLSDGTYKCFAHLYVGRDKRGAVLFSLGVAIGCSVWVWPSGVQFRCGHQVFSLGVAIRCSVWMWPSGVQFGCDCQVFSLGVTVR